MSTVIPVPHVTPSTLLGKPATAPLKPSPAPQATTTTAAIKPASIAIPFMLPVLSVAPPQHAPTVLQPSTSMPIVAHPAQPTALPAPIIQTAVSVPQNTT